MVESTAVRQYMYIIFQIGNILFNLYVLFRYNIIKFRSTILLRTIIKIYNFITN